MWIVFQHLLLIILWNSENFKIYKELNIELHISEYTGKLSLKFPSKSQLWKISVIEDLFKTIIGILTVIT